MSKVALVSGADRYSNVRESLKLIEDEIARKIKNRKSIVIKPNFVSVSNQLAATHIDAVRAVLDVITKLSDVTIIIAEGPASGSANQGFQKYGYYNLQTNYNVRFVDLNEDASHEVEVFNSHLCPMMVKVAKTILKSDFRISVTPMKTHDAVVVTLALKNMLAGSLRGIQEKLSIHQSYPAINKSLFKLAQIIPPHLSIIDGFTAMEGNGPTDGTPVEMRIAICGTDLLAADAIAAYIMGFDIADIGYLFYCREAELGEGDLSKIEVVGNVPIEQCRRKFKPHKTFKNQLNWRIEQT